MTQVHGMLKAALAGQDGRGRSENDFYPTPWEATAALIPEIADFPQSVWEPACGNWAMAAELEKAGFFVSGTDLIDRGYGGGVDFLKQQRLRAKVIITNPPFGKLASQFVQHAVLHLRAPYVAMLTNVNFWHAKERNELFDLRRPSAIHALTWRLDFTGSHRPYFNCCWTVWRPEVCKHPVYTRLQRPVVEDLVG